LRVHQIELEMQNEELSRAQEELEASRARYFDLYDLAPVGYFTLSEEGLILEANLTAAKLLGVPRGALVKQPFSSFILPRTRTFTTGSAKTPGNGSAPVVGTAAVEEGRRPLLGADGGRHARDTDGASVWRAIVTDITEMKRAEQLTQAHSDELHEFADTPFARPSGTAAFGAESHPDPHTGA
jgi:PAS domain S-box-containing protein